MNKIVKTENLIDGMIVGDDVIGVFDTLLVSRGTVIDERVIELLETNLVNEIKIMDTSEEDEMIEGLSTHLEQMRQSDKFQELAKDYSICYDNLESQLNDVINRDKEVDKDEIITGLNTIISKVESNQELLDLLYGMQMKQNWMYMHSINTALISNILGRWLRFSEEDLNDVTLAGLFHDIGMIMLPEELLKKTPDELTKKEKAMVDKHAVYGYRYLMKRELSRSVGLTALTHHERMDGSGYPLQLSGGSLCKCAKVVAIADTYDELTIRSDGSRNPFTLIREFEQSGYTKYDAQYMMVFLAGIMDTYVGCDVLLSDGRVGTIIFINKSDISRPMVKCGDEYISLWKTNAITIEKFV